jgi:hypothetical protein
MIEYLTVSKYMRQKGVSFLALVAMTTLLFACNSKDEPKVDNIAVTIESRRLDQDLAKLDTNAVAQGLFQLKEKYPDFLDFYLDTLMGYGIKGQYYDTTYGIRVGMKPFLSHPDIRGLFDTVAKHFPETKDLDQELKKGFQYMKHYYPASSVPSIIYLITGLNQWSVLTVDTTIVGIGLDMYLGENYPFYAAVQIPDYVAKKCRPEFIPVNVFQAIHRDRHPFKTENKTLLDMMLQRGKEQYFLSKVIPFVNEETRFGFTRQQLEWCNEKEEDVYNFFVRDNLLYETNWQKILRYVNDGPSSVGMMPESPGNVGSWLGYRIIQSYVQKHPGMELEEVLQDKDPQRVLQEAKYKP